MKKIIKIKDEIIFIGCEDGGIQEVRQTDCSGFEPAVGDKVEVYTTGNQVIVIRQNDTADTAGQKENGPNGINIRINNVPAAYAPAGVPGLKAVNKTAYCLLALFLGGLGVHKFYAGRVGTGIIYLLFCWTYIPLLISFIEFIIALCKPADANGMILV